MDEIIEVKQGTNDKGRDDELETFEKGREDVLVRTSGGDEDQPEVIGVLDRRTEYGWLAASWLSMILCGKQLLLQSWLMPHRELQAGTMHLSDLSCFEFRIITTYPTPSSRCCSLRGSAVSSPPRSSMCP
jgi:hypothetical protein